VGQKTIASAFVAALMLTACGHAAEAEPYREPLDFLPAITGDYFPLASKATGTTYHIYVRYPQGYANNPSERYPVVYFLDGDSLFPLLGAQHLFLTIDDKIPDAIIVGIAYGGFDPSVNRRDRDFGSGSEAFQTFLMTELIPRVESVTRADSTRRILVGQSFGGAFVLYSALTQPDLFWARIASNPSFRLHGPALWEGAAEAKRDDLRLLVVTGTENAVEPRKQALDWVARWSGRTRPWSVERIDIKGGTHSADIANAYRLSFRKLFDWSPAPEGDPH
jgi:predicted alpha/beta superfamily hydrolase